MHIITKKRLKDFYEKQKDSKGPLLAWFRIIKNNRYENLADLRNTFPSSDLVGKCIVFNIGGNKYRLITVIHFNREKVFIRNVLTHKAYNIGTWKKGCGND
jgi:mRNA interferase HigB